ncbi:MAG: hypothetical protein RLZZ333_1160 [Bacteroidota bacterium]
MAQLTNRAKILAQKPLTFWESLYLPAIFKGMAITFGHMFKKKPTINYPEQKRPFSSVFRGLHVLNRDEAGRENCTACGLCAVACPDREEKYAAKYEINMLRCIFCGLCEEACPKDAIYLSETFAPSDFTRKGFIYGKENLLIPHPVMEKEKFEMARGQREQQIKNK